MKPAKLLIIVLFAGAALLRFTDVFRPINQASWRECDMGSIARNFVREGMNPLYPRIDWRGSGPGYAEMELPLLPFLTAVTYSLFGIHDQFGRVWAFLFSLGTLFFFFRLAREYLDRFSATVAFAFFAFNPLIVDVSTSIQPEGLMLFTYIAAVYYFVRWLKTERSLDFWLAAGMTALTLLAKASAAHVGLFLGILLIEKYGFGVVRHGRVWLFGILSLLPAALWYFHAKNFWIVYGNSLGVSNEYHWVGVDFFTDPSFLTGILSTEFFRVWVVFGLVVGLFGLWRSLKEQTAKHSLVWLATIFALYIIAARTTSQDWASYYHVFSIPPVALIFGFGIKKLWDYAHDFADTFSQRSLPATLGRAAVILVVIAAILASLMLEAKQVRANFINHRVDEPAAVWTQEIRPALVVDGLILVSGGHCVDKNGLMLAYNASYMFYWLDRKGWNICIEDQSIERVRVYASQGATYFVAEERMLNFKSGFEAELKNDYRVLSETKDFLLFDLTQPR